MTTDAEREAFEAWVKTWKDGDHDPFGCGPLIWDAWQARAALPATKPEPVADDLVERLLNKTTETDDMLNTREVIFKAARRITSNAARITELQAEVERLRAQVERVTSDREYIIGFNAGWSEAVAQNLQFPTMLRKMWSGGEVQRWIDDAMAAARQERAALNTGESDAG